MLKSNKWNENQNDQQQQQCHDDNLYYKCKSQNGIKSEEKKKLESVVKQKKRSLVRGIYIGWYLYLHLF